MERKTEKSWEIRYKDFLQELLSSKGICKENKEMFKEFFEWQERKLKRTRSAQLDESNYKTLYHYIMYFKNINKWFNNKPLKNITIDDIRRVYDDLEDGKILTKNGTPFKDKKTYYSKIFKSKPFEMIGKADLAREVIEFTKEDDSEVRFITEEDFRKLVDISREMHHKLLLWLAWDIGENINSLLRLKKRDITPEKNPHTKEQEYKINLRKEILKRSRKPRTEITNYPETVRLLDLHLKKLKDEDYLFEFDYANAKKVLRTLIDKTEIKTIPANEKPTWKDLRSGMACDLLKKGWTTDEVNARLGHKPSSDEIDKYVNFLAIDRHTPKKKVHQFEMEKLNEEMTEMKKREKLLAERNENLQEQLKAQEERLRKEMEIQMKKMLTNLLKQGDVTHPDP